MHTRVLLPEDKDALVAFAKARLASHHEDEMEAEMAAWNARWRPEALDQYLKLGWSFACYQDDQLAGFVLAQPLLFFRGLTQTLWIEHLSATGSAAHLVDTVYKWARDKHFQCVLMEESEDTRFVLEQWPQARRMNGLIELKSARF